MNKTSIVNTAFALLLTSVTAIGCADGNKTKWPTGRSKNGADVGESDQTFKVGACLQRLKKDASEKLRTQGAGATGQSTYVCRYVGGDEPTGDVAESNLAYGENDYETKEIVPKLLMVKGEGGEDFLIKLKVLLPKGSTAAHMKFVTDTIKNTCVPQINEVWKRDSKKYGVRFQIEKEIEGDSSVKAEREVFQTLKMVGSPSGKAGEFAIDYWPFHSQLKEKDSTEPFCRSFAKLTMLWLGVRDPLAPKRVATPCELPERVEVKDTLLVGFDKGASEVETEEKNFWSEAKVLEDRELKEILSGQCDANSVRAKSSKKSGTSKLKAAAASHESLVEDESLP